MKKLFFILLISLFFQVPVFAEDVFNGIRTVCSVDTEKAEFFEIRAVGIRNFFVGPIAHSKLGNVISGIQGATINILNRYDSVTLYTGSSSSPNILQAHVPEGLVDLSRNHDWPGTLEFWEFQEGTPPRIATEWYIVITVEDFTDEAHTQSLSERTIYVGPIAFGLQEEYDKARALCATLIILGDNGLSEEEESTNIDGPPSIGF